MSHDYHPGLPGYDPEQLYHDGCAECEMRAGDPELSVIYIRDWSVALTRAVHHRAGELRNVSCAEAPVLRMLNAVMIRQSAPNIR